MKGLHSSRSLTTEQIELLMDCHEGEILNQEPQINTAYVMDYLPLYHRGFVEPKKCKIDGKIVVRFFITALGIKMLEA